MKIWRELILTKYSFSGKKFLPSRFYKENTAVSLSCISPKDRYIQINFDSEKGPINDTINLEAGIRKFHRHPNLRVLHQILKGETYSGGGRLWCSLPSYAKNISINFRSGIFLAHSKEGCI